MKFKDLLSKLNEKNELGTPATTKAYASATPSQGKVGFNPDSAVDGVALANELVQGIKAQITKARPNIDIDSDGDVDAMDKKNDNIPDETPDSKKDTLTLIKTRAAERVSTKNEGVSEGQYQSQYKSKKYAIAYAKHRAKTFRDPEDGIEIWSMPDGGFDVVHNMNSNGRNHLVTNGGKKLGTIGPRQQGVAESNHWHNAGVKDSTRGVKPNPSTYLPTLKDKMARHPEEVDLYMTGYKSVKQGVSEKAVSEEVESITELTAEEKRLVNTMYDKKGNLTAVGKKVMDHGKKNGFPHNTSASQGQRMGGKSTMYSEDIQIDESEDKSLARLRQLVRFGLMDKSKLPLITRAMGNLEKGNVTNPTERSVLFDLLDELIGIVTGDDTMFAKVRMSVQREDNDVGR